MKHILIASIYLCAGVCLASPPDAVWVYQEQDPDGTVLSVDTIHWYADPFEIGCWKTLDDCGRQVEDHCRSRGGTTVKHFALKRQPHPITGAAQDTCSGECKDTPIPHTFVALCSKSKPKEPQPVARPTGGDIY